MAPTDHVATARRNLGELAAMQAQVLEHEKQILKRANELLIEAENEIRSSRPGAIANDKDSVERYSRAVEDRGRLLTIIGQARQHIRRSE